jgi:predicted ester cyclase
VTAAADCEVLEVLARRWMAFWQGGSLAGFEELHDPGFVDRAAAGRAGDRSGFKAGIEALYLSFPDFHAETERLVVDPTRGMVAIAWRARGRHVRAFLGRAATGAVVAFRGIEIIRISEGRIVERWGEWDGLSILDQLDAAVRA